MQDYRHACDIEARMKEDLPQEDQVVEEEELDLWKEMKQEVEKYKREYGPWLNKKDSTVSSKPTEEADFETQVLKVME